MFLFDFPHFDHISWNVSHKLKISNRNDRNQLNHSKIIELHCGNTLQPLKSDSEAYKCFYLIFLILIISPEMLVTNWKLVTGMIGNQLNHSKIIELHLRKYITTFEKWFRSIYVFPHFDHISWNVSHKLKISNRNDRESTKPLKNHRIALRKYITTFKKWFRSI